MSAPKIRQLPLALSGISKRDVRTQFAALCYKVRDGRLRVLLITSRGSGRWIIPKGWPVAGQAPSVAAMTEAWEEAGVRGKADPRPLGLFSYTKEMEAEDNLPCIAMVYAIEVEKLSRHYPEVGQRKRKWMSARKAAAAVESPELERIILDFEKQLSE